MTQMDLIMIMAFVALIMSFANASCLWSIARKLAEKKEAGNASAILDAKDIEFTPIRKR